MTLRLSKAGKTNISISLGTIIKTIIVLLVLLTAYLLLDLVLAILVSVVVASAVEPAAKWLMRHRLPRVLSVLIIYLIGFGLFFVLIPFFIFPVVTELVNISATLPQKIGDISSVFSGSGTLGQLTGSLGAQVSVGEFFDSLQSDLAGPARGVFQIASFIFGGLLSFILIIVFSFYLAVQSAGIESFLRVITPIDRENYVVGVWRRARRKIGYWMQGQLLLALIIGVLVFLALTIFGVPYALLLAVVAALFELIPFFGPILAAVPAVVISFSISPALGLIVLAAYIIIQQFENHLIYPLVVRKIVGVPPLLVIIALLAGAQLVGFLGIILAIPASVVLMELATDWEKRKLAGSEAKA
ncbi:MAG: AI-2E family transporter [Patescibacteria group bacterium]|nr:AI-2E family transporter [Patescibacteria group bacterium]